MPIIIECDELASRLNEAGLIIIDLCNNKTWQQVHIPGAVHIDYPSIIHVAKPVMGLLPDADNFSQLLASLGVNNNSHIVAYDDEGGGKASRLLWTLEAFGFQNYSLLNGGLMAWINEGWPVDNKTVSLETGDFHVDSELTSAVSQREEVLGDLNNDHVQLLDARSQAEYNGAKKFAARAGHIPGAIHFDWMELMDPCRHGRLKSTDELKQALSERGFSSDKHIICYCHTHHRSALSFIMLKSLGYKDISGYPGSWSDWGNSSETPIE